MPGGGWRGRTRTAPRPSTSRSGSAGEQLKRDWLEGLRKEKRHEDIPQVNKSYDMNFIHKNMTYMSL